MFTRPIMAPASRGAVSETAAKKPPGGGLVALSRCAGQNRCADSVLISALPKASGKVRSSVR